MPVLGVDRQELHAAWDRVMNSGFYTEGYYVKALEDAIGEWCGMHAVAVNSAGTGLYTMLRMAGVPQGHIAVPVNTFYATGAMTQEAGYGLTLVDCNDHDFSMSFDALTRIRYPLVGVVLTHVGGGLAQDYLKIAKWCDEKGVPLFEDAAHAFGTRIGKMTAGSRSAGAVFSFYPTKAVPAGDGGVIVTRDAAYAQRMREFRSYGKHHDEQGVIRYRRSGFNFRMDEWTAAVAYLQVKRVSQIMELRQTSAAKLRRVIMPMLNWRQSESNWYKYAVYKPAAESLGIVRRSGSVYQRTDQLDEALGFQGEFKNAKFVADNHICLPLDEGQYIGMNSNDILRYLQSAP